MLNILYFLPSATFMLLLVGYGGVALVTLWRHHDWALWRFLPLAAAVWLAAGYWVPLWLSVPYGSLLLLLLIAVCVQTWRGRTWLDCGLRMINAFWLLWISGSLVSDYLHV